MAENAPEKSHFFESILLSLIGMSLLAECQKNSNICLVSVHFLQRFVVIYFSLFKCSGEMYTNMQFQKSRFPSRWLQSVNTF